jgi:formate dehydrogenase subunit gamma
MTTEYDKAIATEIIDGFAARPEMLVQILRAFVVRFSYLCEDAIRQISSELNLSRVEVWGVVRFYDDFLTERPGKTVEKICQADLF